MIPTEARPPPSHFATPVCRIGDPNFEDVCTDKSDDLQAHVGVDLTDYIDHGVFEDCGGAMREGKKEAQRLFNALPEADPWDETDPHIYAIPDGGCTQPCNSTSYGDVMRRKYCDFGYRLLHIDE